MPLGVAFIQETTVFREFGPLAGSTMRLAYDIAPKIGNTLSRQTFDVEARHYLRLGGSGLLATRIEGFKSIGDFPDSWYFGGNSDLRGYDYLEFAGQNAVFANAELRFPLIEAALTPIGVIGGIRGVFFAGIGGAWFNNQPSSDPCTGRAGYKFATSNSEVCRPIDRCADRCAGHRLRAATRTATRMLTYGPAQTIDGFRLKDGRASYGVGPRNVRARLPDPLRLVVADDVQQGVGRRAVCGSERLQHQRSGMQRRVAQAALRGLDRIRLLETD